MLAARFELERRVQTRSHDPATDREKDCLKALDRILVALAKCALRRDGEITLSLSCRLIRTAWKSDREAYC